MEGIVEGCLGFLYDLLVVVCAGLLLLRVAEGWSVRWLVLLLVPGVTLSCLVHSSALKVGLVSVLCSVIHYVGREGVTLPTQNKAVLITGCDSGFGHDLARFLDSAGMRVFAGVLDELSPGALELKKAASPNVTVLQLDITNSSQITQALQYIQSQTGETGLWALVNNAGVLGYVCDGEILPIKMYKKCLDVNFIGSVEITQVFLPLIRQSKGRLINISSMAGEVPLPGFAGYGASKAALISFSGTIRQELSRWGVKVIIIQPGGFKTSVCNLRGNSCCPTDEDDSGVVQICMEFLCGSQIFWAAESSGIALRRTSSAVCLRKRWRLTEKSTSAQCSSGWSTCPQYQAQTRGRFWRL
uniref:Hydroxysteroid (17-beta) dehydrogenase 2 n=1 Tax=Cyprinus carpio TaxID=7962 RepID=A0A8C1NGR1_CYPCA